MTWKSADGKTEASHLVSQLETLILGILNKSTLLDLLRHFIVFEKSRKEDLKTGLISISTVKKLAAYHQYYAVNAAVTSTLRAADMGSGWYTRESPSVYGLPDVKQQPRGDKKAGVVWHTQGSGKSLSMMFYTGKIVLETENPTVLVMTDRNDLDDQLFDTFAASKQLLRQEPMQAESRDHLKELLRVASGGVVFSTIHKFQPDEGNVYELLSDRRNIVVVVDEAHRTQYGFSAKAIDEKNAETRRIRGDGQLFPFPAVQYPRQPGCPAKGDIQFRASVPGLRIGLPVGVAQPFAHRVEGLAQQRCQQIRHGGQAARAGDDHAEAPQRQAHGLRLADRRKVRGNGVDPVVKLRLARHGGISGGKMFLTPINLPQRTVSSNFF